MDTSVLQRPDSVPSMSILIKEVKFTVPQNELITLILRHQVTKNILRSLNSTTTVSNQIIFKKLN